MVAAFVDDGYTESARIDAVDRLYPGVSFRFRPVTAGEFSEYAHDLEMANAAETKQITAEFLVGKLIDWDLRSGDGMRVPITVENVLMLKHVVYLRLFQIVIGDEPGDPDNARLFASDVAENDSKN